jgi:hypothetical protein
MSKPISNAAFKRMILSMTSDQKQETIARQLRILPRFIEEEYNRTIQNEKVIKGLQSKLRLVEKLWADELVSRHA